MELQNDYPQKRIRQATYLFVGLAILCLLPFLMLAFKAHPVADDYAFSALYKRIGWLNFQKQFYLTWQGVFTTNAFMCSPLNPIINDRFDLYWIVSWVTLICFVVCTWVIVGYLLNGAPGRLLTVSAIVVIYLYQLPSPVQALYWLNTAWAYQFCLDILLVWIILLFKTFENDQVDSKKWALAAVLAVLLIGANTILSVMGVYTVFVGAVVNLRNKRTRLWWFGLLLLSLVAFAIVVLAPGNAVRMAKESKTFAAGTSFYVHGLVHGVAMCVYSVINWLGNGLFLAMTVLALPGMAWLSKQPGLRLNKIVRQPLLVLAVSIVGVAMIFFPTYLTQGAPPPPRILDMIYLVFVFLWFINVYSLVAWSRRVHNVEYNMSLPVTLVVGLFVLAALATDHNYSLVYEEKGKSINKVYRAYADLLSGQARTFDTEQKQRYAILQQPSKAGVVLAPLSAKPETIFLADLAPDPNFWFNQAYADFFGKQFVKTAAVPAAVKQP